MTLSIFLLTFLTIESETPQVINNINVAMTVEAKNVTETFLSVDEARKKNPM